MCTQLLGIIFAKLHIILYHLFKFFLLLICLSFKDGVLNFGLLNFNFELFHFVLELKIEIAQVLQLLGELRVLKDFFVLIFKMIDFLEIIVPLMLDFLCNGLKRHIVV